MFYCNDNHSPTGPLVVHHWAQAHNYTTRDWSSFLVTCWISDWPCVISSVEGKPLQVDMWGVVELLLVSYYIEKPRTLLPSTYLICFPFCLSVQRKIWQLLFISAFQISICTRTDTERSHILQVFSYFSLFPSEPLLSRRAAGALASFPAISSSILATVTKSNKRLKHEPIAKGSYWGTVLSNGTSFK